MAIFLLESGVRRNDSIVVEVWHYSERRAIGEQVSKLLRMPVPARHRATNAVSGEYILATRRPPSWVIVG